MTKFSLATGVISSLVIPFTAAAHGGHGASQAGDSFAHYLTEPEHIVVTLVSICLAGAAVALYGRLRSLRSIRQPRR